MIPRALLLVPGLLLIPAPAPAADSGPATTNDDLRALYFAIATARNAAQTAIIKQDLADVDTALAAFDAMGEPMRKAEQDLKAFDPPYSDDDITRLFAAHGLDTTLALHQRVLDLKVRFTADDLPRATAPATIAAPAP
jgi:hypothetical protein